MQKRVTATLGFGAALLAAVVLAACSSGGTSSGMIPSITGGGTGIKPSTVKNGTRITLKIDRSVSHHRRNAVSLSAREKPLYISTQTEGLQISVSSASASGTTQTVYADLSSSSPLCSPASGGSEETCTLVVPTLGTNENIVATEVDQTPTGENTTTGYGTGFPSGSNILAITSTSVTTTPGTVTDIALGLNPVAANLYDCGALVTNQNFGSDQVKNVNNPVSQVQASQPQASLNQVLSRIVVTAGVASGGAIGVQFSDAAGGSYDADPIPLPFVDVNGSPEPITFTSASSHVTMVAIPSPGPSSTPAYSTTGSIPNDGYEWYDCEFLIDVNVDAGLGTPATVTFSNNLSAINLFTGTNYANTLFYEVVPISVSPTTATIAVTGGVTANVTGSDDLASSGMGAESSYQKRGGPIPQPIQAPLPIKQLSGQCIDSRSGRVDATVASAAPIDATTWQQPFTITPLLAGTCTFVLYDSDTGVITQPVTVTVNP
jgi:hypothetical protein